MGTESIPTSITCIYRCWLQNPSEIKTNLAKTHTPFSHFTILQLCCLSRKADYITNSTWVFGRSFLTKIITSNTNRTSSLIIKLYVCNYSKYWSFFQITHQSLWIHSTYRGPWLILPRYHAYTPMQLASDPLCTLYIDKCESINCI